MIKTSTVGIFTVLLMGCSTIAHKSTIYQGENLITPYSGFLTGWTHYSENTHGYQSLMWQHPKHKFADSYAVSISKISNNNPKHYRQIVDKPGKISCSLFSSETLSSQPNAYYPREYWETLCQHENGKQSKVLHLMIKGRDSYYHIQKIWQNNFSSQIVNEWKQRFEKVYLCDTRTSSQSCPITEQN